MPAGFHHRPTSAKARNNAKTLRHSATNAETKMWRLLRDRRLAAFKFLRQTPVEGYILDFVCFERKIVVEVDGSQHFESSHDKERDATLSREGFHVLRYWNNDVLQTPDAVLEDILSRIAPSPGSVLRTSPPSPARGEGYRARGALREMP